MGFLQRLARRIGRSDEDLLTDEVRTWADSVADTTRIADCRERRRTRVGGVVRRLTLTPGGDDGGETLSIVLTDGTGELRATWTGRSRIPGLRLGTRVVLEGLVARERGALRMVNPRYEFA